MKPSKRYLATVKRIFKSEEKLVKEATSNKIAWLSRLKPDPGFNPDLFNWQKRGVVADLEMNLPLVTKRVRDKKDEILKTLEEKSPKIQILEFKCKKMGEEIEEFLQSFLKPQRIEGGLNRMNVEYGEFVWAQWQVEGKTFKPQGVKYNPLF